VNWTPINRGEEADKHKVRMAYLADLERRFNEEDEEDEATSKKIKQK